MGILYVSGDGPSFLVGRDPGNDLVLEGSFVSRRHLRFDYVTYDVAVVEILGTNGAELGGEQVNKGCRCYVRAGDLIRIGHYNIVWIGRRDIINRCFMRSFTSIEYHDTIRVDIEGPPARRVPEKPSVMLAAGPALTMAIPILLGAGRSIAVLSSLFAGAWAAINVLGRIRKQRSEERRRRNAYMSYLRDIEDDIRLKTQEAISLRNRVYPDVAKYLAGGGNPFILWNRPVNERGMYTIRTGIGVIPNPVMINIPRERFAAVDDSLKEMPQLLQNKYKNVPSSPVLTDISDRIITAFLLTGEEDRQMMAAFILQLAASYSPEDLRMMLDLKKDLARYYMWVLWLPHYIDKQNAPDDDMESIILITDDLSLAYESVSTGVRVILAGNDPSCFPEGICSVVNRRDRECGTVFDKLSRKLCFSYAGQLSRIGRSLRADDPLPEMVPFGRLFGLKCENGPHIRFEEEITAMISDYHESNDITRSFAAPIGIGEQGKEVFLDLHEKAAGPHGLIAGTTGSGKSELLTTMIMSFATRFPPDKLAFFLIDYKGGGMSNLFDLLPHLIGNVSNLSKTESGRAMIALKSENIRRQKIFAESHVNNINDYTRLYDAKEVSEPLPHILIIVDEFAELKKEEPDFMDSLISISQVGRSLGMHLILATQKPAGVVDDKIRGNSGFRIALRLVERSDSMDMLQRPDAVDIRECGRAILQVGNDEIFECFQSGYAMGQIRQKGKIMRIYEDFLLEKEVMTDEESAGEKDEDSKTWYELVMKALTEADKRSMRPKCAPLWLPVLPDVINDKEAFAVYDNPYMQRYERAVYDPEIMGHVLISGKSGSGKSELVYTLLNRNKRDSAVYIIDYGGGRLKDIAGCPCCGGYIGDDDPDDIVRMTGFICEMLTRRRRGEDDGTSVILVLDDHVQIAAAADPEASEHITRIISHGRSTGIYVIATYVTIPAGRDTKLFDTRLCLGCEDSYAVALFLKSPARDIPRICDTPGRGVGVYNGTALEFQAVRVSGDEGYCLHGIKAPKYPHVPDKPTLDDLLVRAVAEYPPVSSIKAEMPEPVALPVGYDIKTGKLYTLPIGSISCILVAGKPYSGRHTFIFDISISAARYGINCIRADTYDSLITVCRESESITVVTINSITALLDEFYACPRSSGEEDELMFYFENPATNGMKKRSPVILVGIIENEARIRFSGRRVFESMIKHPYGISFGGSLDENRIFDYSYLSFSTMQMARKSHIATVLKFDEKSYFGNVIIPRDNQCG